MKHTPGQCLELTKGFPTKAHSGAQAGLDSQPRLTQERRLDWIPNQGSLRSAGWTGGAGIISIRAHSGALADSGSRPPGPENFRPGKAPGARLDCCLQKWGVTQTPQIYRLEQKPATNLEKRGLCSESPLKLFVLALRAAKNSSWTLTRPRKNWLSQLLNQILTHCEAQ